MPTFVSLVNLTDQGIKNVADSPKRFETFQEMVENLGLEIKSAYYTQGQYDMVVVIEGPEEAAMVSLLKLVSLGNARFETLRAFSVEEMKRFISKMS